MSVLAFAVCTAYSVRYLGNRRTQDDAAASFSAELGLLFCVIATVSGSIFAKATWGSYWNWDPRETSIFVLLLIYGAYFALRSSVDDPARRRSLAAVYGVLAFITVPLLVFVAPRIRLCNRSTRTADSGHRRRTDMDARMMTVFISSLLGFTGLYAWVFSLRLRAWRFITALANRQED